MTVILAALLIYWFAWVTFSAIFPHAYPGIFIPLDRLFRQD